MELVDQVNLESALYPVPVVDLTLNEVQVHLPALLEDTIREIFQNVKQFTSGPTARRFRLPLTPIPPDQSQYPIQLPFEQGVFDSNGIPIAGCLTTSKKTEIRLLAEGIQGYSSTLRLISFEFQELLGYFATLESEEVFSIPFEEASILGDMPKVFANSKKGPNGGKNRRLPSSFANSNASGGRKFKKVYAFVLQVVRVDGIYHNFSLPFVVQPMRPHSTTSESGEIQPSTFAMAIAGRSRSHSSSNSSSFSPPPPPTLTLDTIIDCLLSDAGWAYKVRALATVLENTEQNSQIVDLLQRMSVSLGRTQAHNYASSALDLLPADRDLALPLDLIETWLEEQSQSVSEQGEDEAQQPTHATEEAEPLRPPSFRLTPASPSQSSAPPPPTRSDSPSKSLRAPRGVAFAPNRFRPHPDVFSASGELPDDRPPLHLFTAFSFGLLVFVLSKLSITTTTLASS